MILKQLVVGPLGSNCYIVGSEASREGMIIDPGDEAEMILNSVTDLGLEIKSIVLTHGHIDHTGALKEIQEATGAEVAIHSDEAKSLLKQPLSTLLNLSYPTPLPPDRLLKNGDRLDIGDLHFLILHTPGHSPGCICLLGERILFSGDTLFNYGIGRTDLLGGDYSQLMNSIHTKLMTLPDNTTVYPGHCPKTTIGTERSGNPFLQA